MNNKSKMFSDWSEVTSGERNQLVFEHLNQSYGAFEIRSNYDKTLLKVFSAIGLFIFFLSTGLVFMRSDLTAPMVIPITDPIIFYPPKTQETVFVPKTSEPPHILPATKLMRTLVPVVTTEPREADNKNIIPASQNLSVAGIPCDTCNDAPPVISEPPATRTPLAEEIHELGDLDRLPHFPGGDAELYRYLRNNVHIPEKIAETGSVKEKVGIVFIIDKDGTITDIVLKQSSKYPELNNEAIRVINKMPKWEPGTQNGTQVKVRMFLPFRFEVKN